ncbi:MAG: cytochrome c [Betaproteobacteria bacterium]|nr:cytochrome c [Betaproteobacteria bacterium]
MRHPVLFLPIAALLLATTPPALADERELVKMPPRMQAHMRANMRDHLLAVHEIQAAMARGDYETAARVAEQRLGMSSLESHGASHMAGVMPPGMRATGTAMHRAASRFAVSAQEAGVDRDLARAVAALAEVTAQCVACHAAYRIQ